MAMVRGRKKEPGQIQLGPSNTDLDFFQALDGSLRFDASKDERAVSRRCALEREHPVRAWPRTGKGEQQPRVGWRGSFAIGFLLLKDDKRSPFGYETCFVCDLWQTEDLVIT